MIFRLVIAAFALMFVACEESPSAPVKSATPNASQTKISRQVAGDSVLTAAAPETSEVSKSQAQRLEETLADFEQQIGLKLFAEPWTGDLDVIVQKRIIRVLTVYGPMRYFMDGPQEKGLTYELFKYFEDFVNEKMGTKFLPVHMVIIPVARDQLIEGLISGRGDIAAAGLTITPERADRVDFSRPVSNELSEILVTGPSAPPIGIIEDLAGRTIFVRASSSYRSSLDQLNLRLAQQGLAEIDIEDAPEQLEDEDILEMVNSGMIEWAVVDDYKAALWTGVFNNLTVRDDLKLREGGRIGYAIRKDSPQLEAMLNEFLEEHKQGTLKGNILINRNLKDYDWAKNALASDGYERFQKVQGIFEKYGTKYGLDYLMVAAQGFQESGLDQSARSAAGAIGIMQMLPSTAADSNVGIPDIETADSNIHAGIKYMDFIRNRYFSDTGMDAFNQVMFSFASYNAGPARIRNLRDTAALQGYDPNIWFDNVEVIAARAIGRETVQYVSNILKYYFAYRFSIVQGLEREAARAGAGIQKQK